MNVSYNWIKQYLDVDLPAEELSDLLTEIGLEVEHVNTFESLPGGLKGLVVGHVLECGKHPDADKLSLTKVNVGGEEPLQIVCGAPNVAAGQKVIVATNGATIHPTEGEPFKIKRAKIRGVESNGMICAEDEIGIGQSHDGILVLPDEIEVGTPAADYFNIERDTIFEIGLTPNRSDATYHIGVAEDLAAALKINYEHSGAVNTPDTSAFEIHNTDMPVEVLVENDEACPRYSGVTISNLKIGPSPEWLVNRLKAIGIRSINNVVDITNFILHEQGQPLHAFDLDKVAGHKIIVKNLPEGTKFTTLDEVERSLHAEDLMICDGNSNGMCIGGVFGGITSGVTDSTTAIFLESAHFEARQLRRSSTRHLLRTDAAKVFEKGSNPNNTVNALKRAALMMIELAGGVISSEIVDLYPTPIEPKQVEVRYDQVRRLIGADISNESIHAILDALNMPIVSQTDAVFTVAVPTNKADVTREADVIEEILRIYGFNKVEFPSHIKSSLSYSPKPNPHLLKNQIGDLLAANGFLEAMALSITQSRYYKEFLPRPEEELVYINNTSNQHLDIMRPDMLFSALDAVLHNQNHSNQDIRLFEFGRSYRFVEDETKEQEHLSLVLSGNKTPENWLSPDHNESSFYTLKAYVEQVIQKLGLGNYQRSITNEDPALSQGMRYHRGPQDIVVFGKVKGSLCRNFGIKGAVYYADFNWDVIMKAMKKQKVIFQELPKFPSSRRDLALVVAKDLNFEDIAQVIRKESKKLLHHLDLYDVYDNEEKLGAGKKSYMVGMTFQDPSKTLTDKEVDKVMKKIIQSCEQRFNAQVRR
ncbi:MAG: phenylalanine--tRNA ligase subunit beta [Bacteroidota bacterium]